MATDEVEAVDSVGLFFASKTSQSESMHKWRNERERKKLAREHACDLPPFRHDSLENPVEQIRLFRIKPAAKYDMIELEMQTFYLKDAPEYDAISYVWGETSSRALVVNDRQYKVRQNCYYALWQIRLHYPGRLIWMDSISIDQDNLHEKSQQVSMMKDIYVQAKWVLACIGPHDVDSRIVLSVFDHIAWNRPVILKQGGDDGQGWDSRASLWDAVLSPLPRAYCERMDRGLVNFYNRTYFQRLWIQQEIAASRNPVQLFCGADRFTWDVFWTLTNCRFHVFSVFGCLLPPKLETKLFPTTRAYDSGQQVAWLTEITARGFDDLDTLLQRTYQSQYTVPHDRLFAILSLVEWQPRKSPLVVDYRQKLFALLLEATRHLKFLTTVELMLAEFKIDSSHAEMQQLRNEYEDNYSVAISQEIDANCLQEMEFGHVYFSDVRRDGRGNLTTLAYPKDHEVDNDIEPKREEMLRELDKFSHHMPKFQALTMHNDPISQETPKVVGFVPTQAQVGDLLVGRDWRRPLYGQRGEGLLVVRKGEGEAFDIIGRGILMPGFLLGKRSSELFYMTLRMTAEEAMLFAGQDIVLENSSAYNLAARIKTLFQMPVAFPQGAVTLRDWHSGSVFLGTPAIEDHSAEA